MWLLYRNHCINLIRKIAWITTQSNLKLSIVWDISFSVGCCSENFINSIVFFSILLFACFFFFSEQNLHISGDQWKHFMFSVHSNCNWLYESGLLESLWNSKRIVFFFFTLLSAIGTENCAAHNTSNKNKFYLFPFARTMNSIDGHFLGWYCDTELKEVLCIWNNGKQRKQDGMNWMAQKLIAE